MSVGEHARLLLSDIPPPPELIYWCREACEGCIWAAYMNRGKTVVCDRK